MPSEATYKNDIDTITPCAAVSGSKCWVCDGEMAEGDPIGRDHRALCHPDRQHGAGDFGHAACIDDAISSGKGSDYVKDEPLDAMDVALGPLADETRQQLDKILDKANKQPAGTLSDEQIEKIFEYLRNSAPERVVDAINKAMECVDEVEAGDSTPHERSTARRWVNFMQDVAHKTVTFPDDVDKVDEIHKALSEKLDQHGQSKGIGTSQNGQGGDGQDDVTDEQIGTEAGTEASGGDDDSGADERGDSPEDSEADSAADSEIAVDYVTHPELDDAIAEAKQDMDTRLMGVGVRLAEQFAEVRDGVDKVNEAIDAFGDANKQWEELQNNIGDLEAKLAKAEQLAARQVRVIEIKRADKTIRLDEEHYHPAFVEAMRYIGRGRDIFFSGPTGCGKTHLAAQIARALDLPFSSCSLSEGIDESNFWGRAELNQNGGMEFYDGDFTIRFENGGVYLGDEADGADPNVLLTFNSAVSNGFCNVPNRHRKPRADRHEDFVFILGANTIGKGADRRYVGRNQLDFSTLKRFEVVTMDYDRDLEKKLVAEILDGAEAAEFCGWAHSIRDKIEENRLEQVFGTREVIWRAEDRQLGDSYEELERQTFKGWRDDEIAKVKNGLPEKAPKATAGNVAPRQQKWTIGSPAPARISRE